MAEGNNLLSIPKFDGDYDHWSMIMENLLRSKEYWSVVEDGYTEPGAKEKELLTDAQRKVLEDKNPKDLKAKNYLFQAIEKSILKTIIQKDTSKQLWDSMKTKYIGNIRVQRAQLQTFRRKFEILEMKTGESVNDYFSRVVLVANNMRNTGEVLKDTSIVEKILRTLTEKFNYIVCSIEESKDIDSLSVDDLQSSLLVHEQKFRKSSVEDQALKVTGGERSGAKEEDRFSEKGRGRGYVRGRGRGRGRVFNKSSIECYKCHKLGHFQYECPSYVNYVEYSDLEKDEEMLLMAYAEIRNAKCEEMWYLDSGCSNHMTGDKKWFIELDHTFRHSVKLGNDSRMAVMGKGNVRMQVADKIQVITEVYYIPELKNNLLSMGQLQEKKLAILIEDNVCKIYHPVKGLIMHTKMSANRMFVLFASIPCHPSGPRCFQVSSKNLETNLWHQRFGHLNMKGLRTLAYKKMVTGLPILKASSELCADCVIRKQHRDPFPKKSLWRASKSLQLVHSDICGPITP